MPDRTQAEQDRNARQWLVVLVFLLLAFITLVIVWVLANV